MATPQHEIDRQHDEAKRLVAEKFPYATSSTQQEIPLSKKTQSIQQRIEAAVAAAGGKEEEERVRLGPYWTTRGHVNVSALQELVRPGYNRRSPEAAPSNSTTATTNCNHETSNESNNNHNKIKKKKKKYTAADIRSTSDYWDPIHAAVNRMMLGEFTRFVSYFVMTLFNACTKCPFLMPTTSFNTLFNLFWILLEFQATTTNIGIHAWYDASWHRYHPVLQSLSTKILVNGSNTRIAFMSQSW
jgi:hypothetical protein